MPAKKDQRKKLLEESRDSLSRQLEEVGATIELSQWEDSRDEADRGNATLEREQSDVLAQKLRNRLRDVDDALHKLEHGKFGRCERCDETIPAARLDARPSSRTCVPCAS